MVTALWNILYLQKAQISGKGGTPPSWFTFMTLSIDASCFVYMVFNSSFFK